MPRGQSKTTPDTAARAKPEKANGNGANLGFEAQMLLAAGAKKLMDFEAPKTNGRVR
jgi:hypothetical protein